MLGYVFIFVQYPAMPTETTCMAQVYVLNTASCLLFGSLFAKVFRVTQIFKPRTAKSLRVLSIQDSALFLGVGITWALEMIYTLAWQFTYPLVPVHLSNPDEQFWICESEQPLWGVIDILANGIFLLYGVLLSIQSRRIPTVFNEAKFVAATMYNTLIIGSIAILLGYTLSKNNDQLYMYKSLGVFVVFTVDICLLIGSKFPALYGEMVKGVIPQFKNNSSSSEKSGGQGQSGQAQAPVESATVKSRESRASPTTSKIEMEIRVTSTAPANTERGSVITPGPAERRPSQNVGAIPLDA
jgi:hypothetical protein